MTIRDARRDLGLTQDDMAERLGITRPTYAKMEEDPGSLTIETARKVCRILGRQFSDIFFGQMVNEYSRLRGDE